MTSLNSRYEKWKLNFDEWGIGNGRQSVLKQRQRLGVHSGDGKKSWAKYIKLNEGLMPKT